MTIQIEQEFKECQVYGQTVVVPACMEWIAICSYGVVWAFQTKPLLYLVAPDSYVWRNQGYECFVGHAEGEFVPQDSLIHLNLLGEKTLH